MADYESILQGFQDLEKQSKMEELRLMEEQRKHDITKEELKKLQEILEKKQTEVQQANEIASKLAAEKRIHESAVAEYTATNKLLRDQLNVMKQQIDAKLKEFHQEKSKYADSIAEVNQVYRAKMELFRKSGLSTAVIEVRKPEDQPCQMPPPAKKDLVLQHEKTIESLKSEVKKKEEEFTLAMQELTKLDEYAKSLEDLNKQYSQSLDQAALLASECPKCKHRFVPENYQQCLEDKMDTESTERTTS